MKKILIPLALSGVFLLAMAAPAFAARIHAICRDGTASHSIHRSGTCSWHEGVRKWLY